jgi:hypothetical protein
MKRRDPSSPYNSQSSNQARPATSCRNPSELEAIMRKMRLIMEHKEL